MKILHGYRDIKRKLKDPVAAIGIFDGIHIGHMKVLNSVLREALPGNDKVILTFDPHPKFVLGKGKKTLRIMSLEHRLSVFDTLGFDAVVIINFTEHLLKLTPLEFIQKVLCHIGVKKVYVGNNFRFGHNLDGDVPKFHDLARESGIEIFSVNPVKKNGKIVSSTWLRKLITRGKIENASDLLRRPVSVLGTVVSGDKLAQGLGFPTANVDPHNEVLPPPGVYAVKVRLDDIIYDGVLNIGFKPTFYGNYLKKRKEPWIEVHVLNYSGNLYGKNIEIFFIRLIRKEKRFNNHEFLKKRILRDITLTNRILSNNNLLKDAGWYRLHRYFLKKR